MLPGTCLGLSIQRYLLCLGHLLLSGDRIYRDIYRSTQMIAPIMLTVDGDQLSTTEQIFGLAGVIRCIIVRCIFIRFYRRCISCIHLSDSSMRVFFCGMRSGANEDMLTSHNEESQALLPKDLCRMMTVLSSGCFPVRRLGSVVAVCARCQERRQSRWKYALIRDESCEWSIDVSGGR